MENESLQSDKFYLYIYEYQAIIFFIWSFSAVRIASKANYFSYVVLYPLSRGTHWMCNFLQCPGEEPRSFNGCCGSYDTTYDTCTESRSGSNPLHSRDY